MSDQHEMERPHQRGGAGLAVGRLLRPRSVAIVGASDKPGALGGTVLANLERQGFDGEIHLVNPKRSEIGGRPCVASVANLPEGIDVVVLAIPRVGVVDAIRGLAARKVGAVIVFAAGFAEESPEGLADQQEIARIAAEAGMVIEGPNCLGFVNFIDNVSLTFIDMPDAVATGNRRVGIVSQSGAMAAVLATTMIARDVPLSCYISTGNEAASGAEDYLAYLVESADTAVVAMVVEHFRNPAAFLAAARAARAANKPVVLLHPGRSVAGAASAATHSGAMAGDYAVMRVHAEHAGVYVVDSLEELGDVVEILTRCTAPIIGGAGVLAESGALKAMLLDLADDIGLPLTPLNDADSPALRAALPSFVPVSNPLDITAQALADPGLYGRTLTALMEDARIGTILIPLIQTKISTSSVKFDAVASALDTLGLGKPVIVAGVDEGGAVQRTDIARLHALGVPYLPTVDRAMRALARILARTTPDTAAASDVGPPLEGLSQVGESIPEYRAKALLGTRGIRFAQSILATDRDAAAAAAATLGFPVVLKAQAAALPHKSDAGGVIVGLGDAAAVATGWDTLHANIAAARPDLTLDGVLVEAMAPRGAELIIGARNDPAWGPVIVIGFGGVAAELLHDIRLLPAGLSHDAIVAEIRRLRMAPLLDGFRGAAPMDVDAVARMVVALDRVMAANPSIREIDLNPVIVYPVGEGALALDALISL